MLSNKIIDLADILNNDMINESEVSQYVIHMKRRNIIEKK